MPSGLDAPEMAKLIEVQITVASLATVLVSFELSSSV